MIEILTGFISGIVSGTGMGGGTILILCLSIFLGIDQKIAQATNLIFFVPTSIAAIYINLKEKNINFKIAKTIIFLGVIGAIIGATIAKKVSTEVLRKCFGVFLSFIAIHEIYVIIKMYKNNKKNNTIKNRYKKEE